MKGRIPCCSKEMFKENYLRYDQPSLRWDGNGDLFKNEIVIYSVDEIWDLLRAKKVFPMGDEELAGKSLPSNDFISYILKVKTVFRKRIKLTSGERINTVFLSDLPSKNAVLDAVNETIDEE